METIFKTVAVTSVFWFVVFLIKNEMKYREEQENRERRERDRARVEIWNAIRELREDLNDLKKQEEE